MFIYIIGVLNVQRCKNYKFIKLKRERCFLVYKKKKQMSSVNERTEPKFWLIRVNDGENLRNSVYPFWGVKNKFKGFVKK